MKKYSSTLLLFFIALCTGFSQNTDGRIIDEIVAIVGDNYILKSDIDKEYETLKEETGVVFTDQDRMQILNSLIAKKILLYKAQLDSIEITDERVDSEIDRRMAYLLSQFPGGEEDFEKYIGKTVEEFKNQSRKRLREDLLVQEMQQKIIKDIKITPTEVRKYYNDIPKDSLPRIDAEVVVAQIVRNPIITQEEKDYAYRKIQSIRQDIMDGADFALTASLESQDPNSGARGGELGFFGRGEMLPEFEAMAFNLKSDTVSKIIETAFGYHILKLIERRGERVNVRHILIKPQTSSYDLSLAKSFLELLRDSINNGTLTFAQAAIKYSNDEPTSRNGGRITDVLGNTKVQLVQLPKDVFEAINTMAVGQINGPELIRLESGENTYKLYYLEEITEPHIANLEEDWLKIQTVALERKKAMALEEWIQKHKKDFYVKVNTKYADHPLLQHWTKK